MRMIILGVLLGIAILVYATIGRTQSESEVWLEDGNHYTQIHLGDDMLLCQKAGENQVQCMKVPPGSVLLIPIPESAPVDSL